MQVSTSNSAAQEKPESVSPKRRSSDSRAAVGAALRAVLRNIQALEKEFALQALAIFQDYLAEAAAKAEEAAKKANTAQHSTFGTEEPEELNIDDTCEALCELGLSAFVDGGEVGDGGAVNIGDGEEARRQLRLWSKSNANSSVFTTDEQCFLWIAWRGRRFVDSADLLWPVFRALDSDTDGAIGLADIERCLQAAAQPVTTLTSPRKAASEPDKGAFDANADAEKFKTELYELLAYHSGAEGAEALISFAQFIAMICDAQDKFALHRLSLTRPAALMMRYDRGVLFMRPEEVSCFAKPGDQEVIDQATRTRDRQELEAVKSDAGLALTEARAAKAAAEAATRMVEDYLESPRTLRTPRSAETVPAIKVVEDRPESPRTPRTPHSPRSLNSGASMLAQRAAMLREAAEEKESQGVGDMQQTAEAAQEAREKLAAETRKKAAELAAKEAEAIARREAEEKAAMEAKERADKEFKERAAKLAEERAAREAARETREKAAKEAQDKDSRDALQAVREARERAAKEAEEMAAKETQLVAAQQENEMAMEIKRAQEADTSTDVDEEVEAWRRKIEELSQPVTAVAYPPQDTAVAASDHTPVAVEATAREAAAMAQREAATPEAAAIEVQRKARGHLARKKVKQLKLKKREAEAAKEAEERAAEEEEERAAKEAQLVAAQKEQEKAMEIKRRASVLQLQRGARGLLARKKVKNIRVQKHEADVAEQARLKELESQRQQAATKIQGVARGRRSRLRVREMKRVKQEEFRLQLKTQRALEEAELAKQRAMQLAELAAERARQEAAEAEQLRAEEEAMRKVFEHEAACHLIAACRAFVAKALVWDCRDAEERFQKKKRESIVILQANLRGAKARKQTRKKKEDATKAKKAEREAAAATKIQASARGRICRNQLKQAEKEKAERRIRENEAATRIQARARGSICRGETKRKKKKAAPKAKNDNAERASSTRAHIEFRFENLDYNIVTSDKTVADNLIGIVSEGISALAGVDPLKVGVALHPGSVVVQASVECPSKTMARALESMISQGDLLERIEELVARIPGIKAALGGQDSFGLGGLKVPSTILASEPRALTANRQQIVPDVPVCFKPEPRPLQNPIDAVAPKPEPRPLLNPMDAVLPKPEPKPLLNPMDPVSPKPRPLPLQNPIDRLAPEEQIPRNAGLSMSPPLRFQRDLVMQEGSPRSASPRMSGKVPKLQLRKRGTMQEPKRAPKEESDQSDVDAEEEDLPVADIVPVVPKLDLANFKQEQLELEQRERLAFEQEQLALKQQQLALEQEQLALEEQRLILEQEMESKRYAATVRIQAHARGSITRYNIAANKKKAKQNRSAKKESMHDELDGAVLDNTLQLPDGSVMPPETPRSPRDGVMPGETSPREAVMPDERSPRDHVAKEGVMPPESTESLREGEIPTERSPREGFMPPEQMAVSPVLPKRRQSEPRVSVLPEQQRALRSGSFSGQSTAMNGPSAGFDPLARGPLSTSQPVAHQVVQQYPVMAGSNTAMQQQSLAPMPVQPHPNSNVQPVQPYIDAYMQQPVQTIPNASMQQPVQPYSNVSLQQPVQPYPNASLQQPVQPYSNAYLQQPVQPYDNVSVQQPVQQYATGFVQQPVQPYSNEFVQQQETAYEPMSRAQVECDLGPAPEQRYDGHANAAQLNAQIPVPELARKQEDIIAGKDEPDDVDEGAHADDEDGDLDDDDDYFEEEEEEEEDDEADEEVEAETLEVSADNIKVETPARAEMPVKVEEVKTGQSPQIPVMAELKQAEVVADKKPAASPKEPKNEIDEAMVAASVAVNGGNDNTGLDGDEDEDEFGEEEEEEEEDDFEDDVAVQSGNDTPATGTPGSQEPQVTESETH